MGEGVKRRGGEWMKKRVGGLGTKRLRD